MHGLLKLCELFPLPSCLGARLEMKDSQQPESFRQPEGGLRRAQRAEGAEGRRPEGPAGSAGPVRQRRRRRRRPIAGRRAFRKKFIWKLFGRVGASVSGEAGRNYRGAHLGPPPASDLVAAQLTLVAPPLASVTVLFRAAVMTVIRG